MRHTGVSRAGNYSIKRSRQSCGLVGLGNSHLRDACQLSSFYDENPFGIYQKVLKGAIDFPKHMDIQAKDLIRSFSLPIERRGLAACNMGRRI